MHIFLSRKRGREGGKEGGRKGRMNELGVREWEGE